ncbi:hypothetical protein E8E12_007247 [Didymella heteroderae]|uniref:Uncharacterized protein n=1 Tax=Didymella heteroderae TaxID=1769908 RepID=A0A9P4WSB4_9PLEO|nr:hypothetical protein E8E12_007247 [Didymella heteroderae]
MATRSPTFSSSTRDSELKTKSRKRVVVYDPQSGNVDIRPERKVLETESTGNRSYQPLQFPKHNKSVSLYIEHHDDTKLKTEADASESDRFLARLTLDHLSPMNRARLWFGLISTLYVAVGPQSSSTVFK